jgi:hypothetical protein
MTEEIGMAIPELNEYGHLPIGIHDCTFLELEARFGQNRWAIDTQENSRREILCPQREQLCGHLKSYLAELRRVGLDVELFVDGSFVTEKPDPNDIDLVVVFPADHDFSRDLPAQEYSLLSKRSLRDKGYLFDLFVVARGDTGFQTAVRLFQRVRGRDDLTKGILRMKP